MAELASGRHSAFIAPQLAERALQAGHVVVALDARGHGERKDPERPLMASELMRNLHLSGEREPCERMIVNTVKDYRVLPDWIVQQPQLETGRVKAAGYSMGAQMALLLSGVDARVHSVAAMVPPQVGRTVAAVAPVSVAARLADTEVWLLTGDDDEYASRSDNAALFGELPGTGKRHLRFAAGHVLPKDYVEQLQPWLTAAARPHDARRKPYPAAIVPIPEGILRAVFANEQTRRTLARRLPLSCPPAPSVLAGCAPALSHRAGSPPFRSSPVLFEPFSARSLQLANRMVMAPLTRSRATSEHTPNALMATYYGQRATAGLIITEGTSPSANGLGYPRIPGLYNAAQAQAWRATTAAVHEQGGKIFVQLMHCGRVAHVANLPPGAEVLGPGSAVCPGEMFTDTLGMQAHSPPRAMTADDIEQVIGEHVAAARLAMDAGFDGVELHAANGYLIEQFLNPLVNQRTDGYGGSNERRNCLALEIARTTVAAIGSDRVGMRVSPYGVFNGTAEFPAVQAQYLTLVQSLSALGLLYVHLVDHSSMGTPTVPADFKLKLRAAFDGLFILSGGFDHASAEQALVEHRGDLVAFGRPFLANPDLVARMREDAPLNAPDEATFYAPGPKGYTDYPTLPALADQAAEAA